MMIAVMVGGRVLSMDEIETEAFHKVYGACGYNLAEAARALHISRDKARRLRNRRKDRSKTHGNKLSETHAGLQRRQV